MNDSSVRERAKLRTAGLRRLKRVTRIATLATAALAALFTAIAARSAPGHKSVRPVHVAVSTTTASRSSIPPPPALPGDSSSSGSSAVSPLDPGQSPAPTQQPPVVVTGGS